MIIVGYPGIGKSTICKYNKNQIDLESSLFDHEDLYWYISYINVAESLNDQGYDVYISSHFQVRFELFRRHVNDMSDILLVYPSSNLKDFWVHKLKDRYDKNPTDKNRRSYEYVKSFYEKTIENFESSMIPNKIKIEDIEYNLEQLIKKFKHDK